MAIKKERRFACGAVGPAASTGMAEGEDKRGGGVHQG